MSRRGKPTRQAGPAASRPRAASEAGQSERLQKLLAAAGLGSRRQCEELILTGRVEVDRKVVTELGSKADPGRQEIRVDGVALPRPRLVHFMVNKPVGVVSTNADPAGRPRVIDLVPGGDRLFSVGRLDMSSEGLILVTNDGELANRLAHPRYGIEKTYNVEVAGQVEKEDLARMRQGVYLAEGFAKVKHVRVKSQFKKSAILEIVLDEGRNREIRRLLARIGHKVLRLKRIALGPLRLGELEPGTYRTLAHDELAALCRATTPEGRRERRKARRSAAGLGAAKQPAPAGQAAAEEQASGRPRRKAQPPRQRPAALVPRRPTVIGGDEQPRATGRGGQKQRPAAPTTRAKQRPAAAATRAKRRPAAATAHAEGTHRSRGPAGDKRHGVSTPRREKRR